MWALQEVYIIRLVKLKYGCSSPVTLCSFMWVIFAALRSNFKAGVRYFVLCLRKLSGYPPSCSAISFIIMKEFIGAVDMLMTISESVMKTWVDEGADHAS